MSFASILRHELAERALKYAQSGALMHSLSYGELPIVCFMPDETLRHGNFTAKSYKAIVANPAWRQRLTKVHTQGRRSLPATDRGLWMELDSCMSSDALLMNIFCDSNVLRSAKTSAMLGIEAGSVPHFGYKARVPLASGRYDRTEVDMRLGNQLVEAKLTEGDFQCAIKRVLANYRDFNEVFDTEQLPQTEDSYLSYQLLRNVLAAYALQCSFCVLLDARRPDLIEACYAVMRCVKRVDLRTALTVLTWQELAQTLPTKLQTFLATKYGIEAVGAKATLSTTLAPARPPMCSRCF
jgi:hypothetical protein